MSREEPATLQAFIMVCPWPLKRVYYVSQFNNVDWCVD